MLGLHPSLALLLKLRTNAARRRIVEKMRDPRQRMTVVAAGSLAALWIANVVASVWLRERADPLALEMILASSLTAYLGWHVVRIACFPPVSPLEQPARERKLLTSLPLDSQDLVTHHLVVMALAAGAKATLATTLLLPDLPVPPVAWLGVVAALLAVEMVRQLSEILVWSLSPRQQRIFRASVLLAAIVLAGSSFSTGRRMLTQMVPAPGENILSAASECAVGARDTLWGEATRRLWRPFLRPILADDLSLELASELTIAALWLGGLAWMVCTLHQRRTAAVVRRERAEFARSKLSSTSEARRQETPIENGSRWASPSSTREKIVKVWGFGGIGTVFWRQARGASRHAWGLLVALTPPALLALSPLGSSGGPEAIFLAVAGALAFYTFLLLPTALKFDFRRDLERMAMLKSLPLPAWAIALGQLATPVALATCFQALVLTICQGLRPVSLVLPCAALGLFLLLNTLVFAIDNLVFLKHPHRLQQEGLSVLLGTMLTFTAKGILFAAGLAITLAWLAASHRLATWDAISLDWRPSAGSLFMGGMAAGLLLAVTMGVAQLAQTFERFDPAQHRC